MQIHLHLRSGDLSEIAWPTGDDVVTIAVANDHEFIGFQIHPDGSLMISHHHSIRDGEHARVDMHYVGAVNDDEVVLLSPINHVRDPHPGAPSALHLVPPTNQP